MTAPPTRFYCYTWNRFASRSTWRGFSLKNDLSPVREPQYLDDRTRDWFLVVGWRLCIDECTIWNLLSKALRLGVSDMRHEKHRWAWRVYDQDCFKIVAFLNLLSNTALTYQCSAQNIYPLNCTVEIWFLTSTSFSSRLRLKGGGTIVNERSETLSY